MHELKEYFGYRLLQDFPSLNLHFRTPLPNSNLNMRHDYFLSHSYGCLSISILAIRCTTRAKIMTKLFNFLTGKDRLLNKRLRPKVDTSYFTKDHQAIIAFFLNVLLKNQTTEYFFSIKKNRVSAIN